VTAHEEPDDPAAIIVGSLVGVGTALAVTSGDEEPSVDLFTFDRTACVGGESHTSVVDPILGGTVDKREPAAVAEEWIHATNLNRTFPGLTTKVSDSDEDTVRLDLVSADRVVGQYNLEHTESGWVVMTMRVCSK